VGALETHNTNINVKQVSTWFHSTHDSPAGLEHSIVDDFLVVREFSIDRKRAGDV